MAAAYAALVSLMQVIDQIEHHPRPPIYLDKEQVESLTEKVTILQKFLEAYPLITDKEERDLLESRIAGAAYMAEDIVESHIVDQIQDGNYGENIIPIEFYQGLQRAIEDLDVIKKEAMEDKSWELFSKIVFGCPPEVEEIGKKIVRSCRGLPLSLVVIGGILAKSGFEREYWEHIEENLNSILNSQNDEQCLKILEMSYNELPVHLKPCFLYIGIFIEDSVIYVSELVKLWVAEGFIKAVSDKNLEEVGEEYVKDLVDRNLILVHKLRYTTKEIKQIKIHDLLRDLCLRQAQKEKFYNVVRRHSVGIPQDTHSQRRLIICDAILEDNVQHALLSMSLARSLISYNDELVPSPYQRLLRILDACDAKLDFYDYRFLENQLVNLRTLLSETFLGIPYLLLHCTSFGIYKH